MCSSISSSSHTLLWPQEQKSVARIARVIVCGGLVKQAQALFSDKVPRTALRKSQPS